MKKFNEFKSFKDLKSTALAAVVVAILLSPFWLIMVFNLINQI